MATGTKRSRDTVTFEPCGPISAIIDKETRNGGHGARTRYLEKCVATTSGKKHPDLLQKYRVIYEEKTGVVPA